MICQKYEKWISDALDGALSERKKRNLNSHLTDCSDCHAYQESLSRIQAEALRLDKAKVSPSYWENFSASLKKRLQALEPEREAPRALRLSWKWAWAGAPVFLALGISLVFLLNRGQAPENDIFSYEACLSRLHLEIGDDAKLEDNFNHVILGSLRGGLDSAALEERYLFSEDPFFWESLNEEELEFIEQEIKKEMKS
jgi:predicted anti-sigma-YlaC factor YlaD